MFYKQYAFWAAVVAVAYIVLKHFKPDWAFSQDELLAAVILLLSMFGFEIERNLRARGFLPNR